MCINVLVYVQMESYKHMAGASPRQKVLRLVRRLGVARSSDLTRKGLHPEYLRRLTAEGELVRTGRGLYVVASAPADTHHTLAEACRRVPCGVICLLSALRFHELGTQNPAEVWMAVPRSHRIPKTDYPPLRAFRFTGAAYELGIEDHRIDGVECKIYAPAKTVADCFKYRNKIGLDVALEALRDYRRKQKGTADDLWRCAEACRVARVMKPYMESIT